MTTNGLVGARGGRLVTTDGLVEARDLTKVFPMPARAVTALSGVSLRIDLADYVAVSGPSGCGKSTLLHLLGCVEPPTGGSLRFEGREVTALSDAERSRLRLLRIGFIFQRFFLLPMLTAWENVELPQGEAGMPRAERRRRTAELLDYVGLTDRADHRPAQLSGGEMQRVAIAPTGQPLRACYLAGQAGPGELERATAAEGSPNSHDRAHATERRVGSRETKPDLWTGAAGGGGSGWPRAGDAAGRRSRMKHEKKSRSPCFRSLRQQARQRRVERAGSGLAGCAEPNPSDRGGEARSRAGRDTGAAG